MTDHKEYIYAVYQEKNFSKAAQKLHVSQSWLSVAVKKVEQDLGCLLFDRSTNPLTLTEAGRYYINCIEQIMSIEHDMNQYFKELHSSAGTELRIGSSMFFCTYVLPNMLSTFKETYPQVTLTYFEGSSRVLTEKLINGKLDFLLEAEHLDDSKLKSIPWAVEELTLAVPAHYKINRELSNYCYTFEEFIHRNHFGYKKPAVPLQAFRDETFILLKEGNDSHNRCFKFCENAGFMPTVSMYCAQMMTAYYLVCEGQGIAFLRSTIPEYVSPTDRVVFYQLDDPLATRNIYLSYPKKNSGSIRHKLIDFILEQGSISNDRETQIR